MSASPAYTLLRRGPNLSNPYIWLGVGLGAGITVIAIIAFVVRKIYLTPSRTKQQQRQPPDCENATDSTNSQSPMLARVHGYASFARAGSSVTKPANAPTPPPKSPPTDQEIILRHKKSGFIPRPFSVHIEAHPPSPDPHVDPNAPPPSDKPPTTPVSIHDHLSVLSMATDRSSPGSHAQSRPASPLIRRVKQAFRPVLPDELGVIPGDKMVIVQAYSDGWFVVARDREQTEGGEVELGAVPSWVFSRPPKGSIPERPLRETSLRIAVQSSRNVLGNHSVLSWTNM